MSKHLYQLDPRGGGPLDLQTRFNVIRQNWQYRYLFDAAPATSWIGDFSSEAEALQAAREEN